MQKETPQARWLARMLAKGLLPKHPTQAQALELLREQSHGRSTKSLEKWLSALHLEKA